MIEFGTVAWSSLLLSERGDHLGDDGFGFGAHLGVGGVLNRVVDENAFGVLHAKRAGLRLRRVLELGRRYADRRRTLNLEPYRVVQTARGTGASVGQRLDNKVVRGIDFQSQRRGRRFRERRLRIATDLHGR